MNTRQKINEEIENQIKTDMRAGRLEMVKNKKEKQKPTTFKICNIIVLSDKSVSISDIDSAILEFWNKYQEFPPILYLGIKQYLEFGSLFRPWDEEVKDINNYYYRGIPLKIVE